MTALDTLAEQAARRAMMAPKGKRRAWAEIARRARLAALTNNPAQRRAILKALEA